MKNWLRSIGVVSALFLAWIAVPAMAALDLPPGYPSAFDWSGYVDEYDAKNSVIIVNDRQFTISGSARVHGPKGSAGVSSLRKGLPVGLKLRTEGRQKIATDFWIVPDPRSAN
jgi:hypothetical protein